MADLQQIAENLSALTVMEAAQLVKMLEEKWGVSAAAAAPVRAGGGGGAAAGGGGGASIVSSLSASVRPGLNQKMVNTPRVVNTTA